MTPATLRHHSTTLPAQGGTDQKANFPSERRSNTTPAAADDNSIGTLSVHEDLPESSPIYHVYNSAVKYHFTISVDDPDSYHGGSSSPGNGGHGTKTPLFYVKNSQWTHGTFDLVMHAGSKDANGPVVGVAKLLKLASTSKLALGDPILDERHVVWEDMTRESSYNHTRYRWEITVLSTDSDGGGSSGSRRRTERRAFIWKRTHSVGVEKTVYLKLSLQNYKLVDEKTGELVAVFTNNGFKSLRKTGKFQLSDRKVREYGKDFEAMVFLTGLAVVERGRRRRQRHQIGD